MDATEDLSIRFNAVSDNPAIAMRANWRERVDRAFEAVKRVVLPANDYFKRFVIFIFANFAGSHIESFARRDLSGGVFFVCEL